MYERCPANRINGISDCCWKCTGTSANAGPLVFAVTRSVSLTRGNCLCYRHFWAFRRQLKGRRLPNRYHHGIAMRDEQRRTMIHTDVEFRAFAELLIIFFSWSLSAASVCRRIPCPLDGQIKHAQPDTVVQVTVVKKSCQDAVYSQHDVHPLTDAACSVARGVQV